LTKIHRCGLARAGDRRILAYAVAHDFILVSTDSDFERLARQISGAKVVVLRSCDYPTDVAAEVLRRNAVRIAELPSSQDHLIILNQQCPNRPQTSRAFRMAQDSLKSEVVFQLK